MFTTTEQVLELTGYATSIEGILRAQTVIEAYVGRVEAEVDNANDVMLLARATAFQCAYMGDEEGLDIFTQVAAVQTMQYGASVRYRENDIAAPFIAPLAVFACRNLTFKRIRSVKTGRIFQNVPVPEWRTE